MAYYSSTPTCWSKRAAKPALKLQTFIKQAINDGIDDTECHADEWVLPTPIHPDFFSQSRSRSIEHQFECKSPSPLMHDMTEDYPPPTTATGYLPPSSSSSDHDQINREGGTIVRSSSIPIPKRIRRHRRTESEIMIRLTDSEFGLAQDGRAFIKSEPDSEMNALILPAAIDAFGSKPAAFFSSSTCCHSTEKSESYPGLISKEIQRRRDARKRLENLDTNDEKLAEQKGREALRRMLWGKEISDLYPVECVRDFG